MTIRFADFKYLLNDFAEEIMKAEFSPHDAGAYQMTLEEFVEREMGMWQDNMAPKFSEEWFAQVKVISDKYDEWVKTKTRPMSDVEFVTKWRNYYNSRLNELDSTEEGDSDEATVNKRNEVDVLIDVLNDYSRIYKINPKADMEMDEIRDAISDDLQSVITDRMGKYQDDIEMNANCQIIEMTLKGVLSKYFGMDF